MSAPTILNSGVLLGLFSLRRASVTLTDAQTKALPTSGITLVAAPGANKAILPQYGGLFAKTAGGAYTNINAAGFLEIYVGTSALILSNVPNDAAITNGSATRLTQLLGTTTPSYAPLVPMQSTENVNEWGPIPFIVSTANITNQPLTLDIDNAGGGNLTGGNAANTLTVMVWYFVVDVP